MNKKVIVILLAVLFIIGCAFQVLTTGVYFKMDDVEYLNLDNEPLNAKYYPGTIDKGVLIANDFGHNMSELSAMINEFAKLGYHVYVFDFPSQGNTNGYIQYGYRQSAYVAEQYYCAVVSFSQLAQLSEENIHIVASGVGARSALLTSAMGFFSPRDLTLINTDTNLQERLQFDVINFYKDENIDWINSININNPGLDIRLLYSLNKKEGKLLNKKLLSAAPIEEEEEEVIEPEVIEPEVVEPEVTQPDPNSDTGLVPDPNSDSGYTQDSATTNDAGNASNGTTTQDTNTATNTTEDTGSDNTNASKTTAVKENDVELKTYLFTTPSSVMKDGKIINETVSYIADKDDLSYSSSFIIYVREYITFALIAILFAIVILIGNIFYENNYVEHNYTRDFTYEFAFHKLLIYVPSLILVFVVPVVFYFTLAAILPFPYFDIMKVSIISCYGIVLYFIYKKTTFADDIGEEIFIPDEKKDVFKGLFVYLIVIVAMSLVSLGGMDLVFNVLSIKLLWMLLFSLLSWFIFFIDEKEKDVIEADFKQRAILSGINFGSILIVAIFLLPFGEFALSFEFLQVTFTIIFVLALGRILKALQSPTALNAFLKASLLYTFILAQSVLFYI